MSAAVRSSRAASAAWVLVLACESGSSPQATPSPASGGATSMVTGGASNGGTPGASGSPTVSGGNGGRALTSGGATVSAAGGSTGGSATLGGGSGAASGAAGSAGSTGGTPRAGSSGATSEPEWKQAPPKFAKHEIASFMDGYYTAAFDVNGDGKPDVAALSASRSQLVWFKNPSWERYTITTGTTGFICMAPYDVDADGHTDLAIASEFSMTDTEGGGSVYWVEAPDDPTQTWTLHPIDEVPTSHRLRWGDIDGDGKKELLNLPLFGVGSKSPEYVGPVELKAYVIPSDPKGPWQVTNVNDTLLEVAHGISLVDWDGDENEDILTASNAGVTLFQPGLMAQPKQLGVGDDGARPNRGSSEVGLGKLGTERFLATIEPWHGTDAVVYTPGATANDVWERRVLGSEYQRGHALAVADFDGDGYDEIVGGDQNGGGALILFRYVPSADTWEPTDIDRGGVAVIGIDLADINGDGALDIVAIGGASNNVVWYENTP